MDCCSDWWWNSRLRVIPTILMEGMCVGWRERVRIVKLSPWLCADIFVPLSWHSHRYECGTIGTASVDHGCILHSMSIIHICDTRASLAWNESFTRAWEFAAAAAQIPIQRKQNFDLVIWCAHTYVIPFSALERLCNAFKCLISKQRMSVGWRLRACTPKLIFWKSATK